MHLSMQSPTPPLTGHGGDLSLRGYEIPTNSPQNPHKLPMTPSDSLVMIFTAKVIGKVNKHLTWVYGACIIGYVECAKATPQGQC